MRRGDEKVLYVGLDESNHGRYPEIIVAVSSLIKSDASPVSVSKRKRMEENELKRFLKNEKRDFSYVVVSEDYICLAKNCLLNFAPSLINRILTDLNENQTEVESIDILIDGDVRVSEISELGSSARELFCKGENVTRTISCRKYPKSGRVYKYPKLLVAADSLAHYLFRNKSFEEKIKAYDKEIVLD